MKHSRPSGSQTQAPPGNTVPRSKLAVGENLNSEPARGDTLYHDIEMNRSDAQIKEHERAHMRLLKQELDAARVQVMHQELQEARRQISLANTDQEQRCAQAEERLKEAIQDRALMALTQKRLRMQLAGALAENAVLKDNVWRLQSKLNLVPWRVVASYKRFRRFVPDRALNLLAAFIPRRPPT